MICVAETHGPYHPSDRGQLPVEEQERRVLRVRFREQGVRPQVPAKDLLRLHHFVVGKALECTSSTLTHFFDRLV